MKSFLVVLGICFGVLNAQAQGTVSFVNRVTGTLDAPIFNTDGVTRLSGTAYLAQIFAGPSEAALEPIGAPLAFRTGAGVGYVDPSNDSTRTITTVAPQGRAYLQVRAWDAARGSTYAAALTAGGATGSSPTFSLLTGGGLVPPVNLIGLQSFSLRLSTPPSITTQPLSVTTGLGGTARFTVVAAGSPPLGYQWYKGTATVPGATSATYQINSVTAGDAASYSVLITNAYGRITSSTAPLVIAPLPTITGVTVSPNPPLVGRALHMEVAVTGAGPITYQWQLNSADLAGATLAFLDRSSAEAGVFSVKVTGPGGTARRDVATVIAQYILTLTPPSGGTATATPSQTSYASGVTITLRATADPGFAFSGWSGDLTGTDNPTTLVMNGHKLVEAVFRPTGGTVYFANRITGLVDAPVFDIDGVTRLDANFVAALYAGPTLDTLAAVGTPIAFRSGDGIGYFPGDERSVPNVSAGGGAVVQVRAWRLADGATYEAAVSGGGRAGASEPLTLVTGNFGSPPSLPASLIGLKPFSLQVGAAPRIITQPGEVLVALGGTARFQVAASGSTPLQYQWRKDGKDIAGATSASYEIRNVATVNVGQYSVHVSNSHGFVDSIPARLTVATLPAIASILTTPNPPHYGKALRLEVVATGTPPLAYAWLFNGTAVDRGTNAVLEIPIAQAGTYSIQVTGPGGSVSRTAATLTAEFILTLTQSSGGTLTASPSQPSYTSGTIVSLDAAANLGYEFSLWSDDVSGSFNPIQVIMNSDKTVTAVFRPTGGTVNFVNRITGLIDAPVFNTDGVTRLDGAYVAQLYAGATADRLLPVGAPIPFRDGVGVGYFVGDERSIPTVAAGALAQIQVRAWKSTDGLTYEAALTAGRPVGTSPILAVVTGNFAPPGSPPTLPANPVGLQSFKLQSESAPSISRQPAAVTLAAGATARFEVVAAGMPTPTFQWRKGTTDIPGATSPVLQIANVGAIDVAAYSVRVSNRLGFVDSSSATLSLLRYTLTLAATDGGHAEATPNQSSFDPGASVRLDARADAGYVFASWSGDLTGTANPATVLMNANLTITPQFRPTAGVVSFANKITGVIDAAVRDVDNVTLLDSRFAAQLYAGPTASTLQPIGKPIPFRDGAGAGYITAQDRVIPTVAPGATAQVQMRAWRLADGATYEAAVLASGHAGSGGVFAVVTGNSGTPPTLPALLTGLRPFNLQVGAPPTIGTQPRSIEVALDGLARFEVIASGLAPLSYAWTHDGTPISGANAAVLEIRPVRTSDAGAYRVQVSNSLGSILSDPANLVLLAPTVITKITTTGIPVEGRALHFEVVATGTPPLTYQWLFNSTPVTGETRATLDVASARVGTYSVTVSGRGGVATQDAAKVTAQFVLTFATAHGGQMIPLPAQSLFDPGSTVSMSALADPGYEFSGWTGDLTGTANPARLLMDASKSVGATFRPTGGTVNFVNRITGVIDAPVYDLDGKTPLEGDRFIAQFFAGPTALTLGPVGSPVAFGTGLRAGYFPGEERSIPTVPPGGVAFVQIRAWELAAGATFDLAAASNGKIGVSPVLRITTGNVGSPPTLPAFLLGLASFHLDYGRAPSLVTAPEPVTAILGTRVEFVVAAEGLPSPQFQWIRNGLDIAGATSTKLEFSAVQSADTGLYSVRIHNVLGEVITTPVQLLLIEPPAIVRLVTPSPVAVGESAMIEVIASGQSPLHYQWFQGLTGDVTAPMGGNAAKFNTGPLAATTPFWVRVSNVAGHVDSQTVEAAVLLRTQIITFSAPAPTRLGAGRVALAAFASSGLPVSFTLVSGPATIAGNIVTPSGAGDIRIRASQSGSPVFEPAPDVEQTLVVAKGTATITFGQLEQLYDGNPKMARVSVNPTGLQVNISYEPGPGLPSGVGLYTVTAVVDEPDYTGRASALLRIIAPAGVSGFVFNDANNDQLRGSDELGIPDVGVLLFASDGVTELQNAQSGPDGAYAFANVSAGNYFLLQEVPAGFTNTTATFRSVTVAQTTLANVDFGDQQTGSIVGVVFEDLDGDGLRDVRERGLANVIVRLTGSAPAETTTTSTTPDGSYRFDGLQPGSYTVEELGASGAVGDPTGFTSTTLNRRTANLAPGDVAEVYFGDQPAGVVSGNVFVDINRNGNLDSGEPSLSGVRIRLLRAANGTQYATGTTGTDGAYRFSGVEPGSYFVEETDPPGYSSTSSTSQRVLVTSGGSATVNFLVQPTGSIAGSVFADANGNDIREPGEPGIPGATIHLSGPGGSFATTTASDGSYSFTSLAPGIYTVEEFDPPGFVSSKPNVRAANLPSGGSATVSFAGRPVQTISGMVFEDTNGNGRPDPGEPGIGGVQLLLLAAADESLVAGTATDGSGLYVFADVPAGAYLVRQAVPDAYTVLTVNGVPPRPSLLGTPTPPDFVTKSVQIVEGGAASASFANNVVGQLSGMVFDDLDGSGSPSTGEPGLGGAILEVRRADTGVLVKSTTTAGNGLYQVSDLPVGSYRVTQLALAGYFTPNPTMTVTLSSGSAATASFATRAGGTVSGRVFNDENGNASLDGAESGLGSVRITLQRAGSATLQTASRGDGTFVFTNVAPGAITIEQTPPTGFHSTTPASTSVSLAAGASIGTLFGNQSDDVRPPTISAEPADLALGEGASGELKVVASGTGTLDYQWLKDGSPLPGATSASIAFAQANAADSGLYQVRVRNAIGSTLSRVTKVTVLISNPFASWTSAHNLPAASRRPQDDPDKDGLPNLIEFLVGTDPGTPSTAGIPLPVEITTGGKHFAGFELSRSHAARGLRVFLEASDDLTHWSEIPSIIDVAQPGLQSDLIWVTDLSPVTDRPFRFLRLGVSEVSDVVTSAKLHILSAPPLTTGFRLSLEGTGGTVYAVERSDDLKTWTFLQNVTAGATAVFIIDGDVAGSSHRFYRAVAR